MKYSKHNIPSIIFLLVINHFLRSFNKKFSILFMLLFELVNLNDILSKISKKELPLPVTYKLLKVLKLIKEDIDFFNKQRIDIYKKYGNFDKETINIPKENTEKFMEEMKELTNIEVKTELPKFKITELAIDISIEDMDKLMILIDELE